MGRIEVNHLSKKYEVRKLEESDIPQILELCQKNPKYYRHCPPEVSSETIRKDMIMLPPNKTLEDKYYVGFFEDINLVAVMELIDGYPNEETVFIGFFMMNMDFQGQGIGSKIVTEVCEYLSERFSKIRLGYVKGNEQSEHFWLKNSFKKTGVESKQENYTVVVLERGLKEGE